MIVRKHKHAHLSHWVQSRDFLQKLQCCQTWNRGSFCGLTKKGRQNQVLQSSISSLLLSCSAWVSKKPLTSSLASASKALTRKRRRMEACSILSSLVVTLSAEIQGIFVVLSKMELPPWFTGERDSVRVSDSMVLSVVCQDMICHASTWSRHGGLSMSPLICWPGFLRSWAADWKFEPWGRRAAETVLRFLAGEWGCQRLCCRSSPLACHGSYRFYCPGKRPRKN